MPRQGRSKWAKDRRRRPRTDAQAAVEICSADKQTARCGADTVAAFLIIHGSCDAGCPALMGDPRSMGPLDGPFKRGYSCQPIALHNEHSAFKDSCEHQHATVVTSDPHTVTHRETNHRARQPGISGLWGWALHSATGRGMQCAALPRPKNDTHRSLQRPMQALTPPG